MDKHEAAYLLSRQARDLCELVLTSVMGTKGTELWYCMEDDPRDLLIFEVARKMLQASKYSLTSEVSENQTVSNG